MKKTGKSIKTMIKIKNEKDWRNVKYNKRKIIKARNAIKVKEKEEKSERQ